MDGLKATMTMMVGGGVVEQGTKTFGGQDDNGDDWQRRCRRWEE